MNISLWKHTYADLMRRSPARLVLLVAYVALGVWASVDGVAWRQEMVQLQADKPADLLHERKAWLKKLEDVNSGKEESPYAARPMNLTLLAELPPGPLSELAHRSESIFPHTALINGWKNDAALFRRYEVEGPSPLAVGGLDLSSLAAVFFPLVLLLSSFDALSREREPGRLGLLMVQGLGPRQIVRVRVLATALLLWLVTTGLVLITTLAAGSDALNPRLWLWLGVFVAYCVFWTGICSWVAVRFEKGRDAALASLGAWVLVVLLLPAMIQFSAQVFAPIPSRVVYLTQARAAESEARRDIEQRAEIYMAEHDLEVKSEESKVPEFFKKSFLANAHINERTAPIIARVEEQREQQASLVDRLEYLAPAMLAYHSFQAAAGTGSERAGRFRHQVREHLKKLHAVVGPATVAKKRISMEEARGVPTFKFQEEDLTKGSWMGLFWLLGSGLLSWSLAMRRATTLQPTRDTA